MRHFWQDLKYGARILTRSPGFTTVIVLTLALGIGANTAIFTVVNAVMLSSLPARNPQELALLTDPIFQGMRRGSDSGDRAALTYAEFQALAADNEVFSGILATDSSYGRPTVALEATSGSEEGSPAGVSLVSGTYFPVLGVNPVLGRMFGPEVDNARDANPVAVISYGFWKGRLGGDPSVVGRKLRIRDTSYEIEGVAPPDFFGVTVGAAPDIWVPLTMQAEITPGEDNLSQEKDPREKTMWLTVMGRLKPGVSLAQAKASINVSFQQYLRSEIGSGMSAADLRDFFNQNIALVSGTKGASILREQFGQPLLILMGLVGLVLLIACANVANLLLARAASREKEIAVRITLGAGRARLFAQLLTESVMLAAIGGALGLLLAQWADSVLVRLVSTSSRPVPLEIHPDVRILGFTLGVSLLTGILFGLAPAIRATRVDLNPVLKANSRGVVGATHVGRIPVGKILIVTQVALSLVLLIVAGLFVHSFRKLTKVNLGFDHDHLLIFSTNPNQYGYKGPEIVEVYKEMSDRIRAVPGVKGVTVSMNGLFSHSESGDPIEIEGYTPKSGQDMNARWDQIGPNYFSTVGIPMVMGRDIELQDGGNGQRVGVINQTMARYYFGDENPIGKRIMNTFPTERTDFVVVGVAADAKYNSVREETPRRFYVPFFNPMIPVSFASVEVLAAGSPSTVAVAVREAVKETSSRLPPIDIQTMNALVSQSLTRDTMLVKLSGFFGMLAVLLACVGIYGVMAYAVANRTNEIGIRMALGAQPGNISGLVLRESMILVVIGVAIGLPLVFLAEKAIASLLFGLSPADPASLILASALMFGVAGLAGYLPARRAARVDPMIALRYE